MTLYVKSKLLLQKETLFSIYITTRLILVRRCLFNRGHLNLLDGSQYSMPVNFIFLPCCIHVSVYFKAVSLFGEGDVSCDINFRLFEIPRRNVRSFLVFTQSLSFKCRNV